MKWFKCFSYYDPALKELVSAFGYDGYGVFCRVIEECQLRESYDLDAEDIKRWTGLRRDRAEKLFPYVVNAIEKLNLTKDKCNLTKDKSDLSLDLDASNPRGRNNITKNRIEENKTPLTPQEGEGAIGFDQFWEAYPRKVAKAAALKVFNKLKPCPEEIKTMLSALDRSRQSHQWQKDGGAFIPHASTWLNQKRWEDEVETPLNGSTDGPRPSREASRIETLLSARAIKRTYDGTVVNRSELSTYEGITDALFWGPEKLITHEWEVVSDAS